MEDSESQSDAIMAKYRELLANVGAFHALVRARYPTQVTCGAGCFSCCKTRLSVFPLEAEAIRRGAAALGADVVPKLRERLENDSGPLASYCAFLVEGACTIYEDRPLLCRIHGLPNASTTYPPGIVDVCELNFTDMSGDEIAPEAILDWDHAGKALALLNFKFNDLRGRDRFGRLRVPLVELAREASGLDAGVAVVEDATP